MEHDTTTNISLYKGECKHQDTQLFDDFRWENTGSERSPENGVELRVQTTDAHLVKVPVGIDNGLVHGFAVKLRVQL